MVYHYRNFLTTDTGKLKYKNQAIHLLCRRIRHSASTVEQYYDIFQLQRLRHDLVWRESSQRFLSSKNFELWIVKITP